MKTCELCERRPSCKNYSTQMRMCIFSGHKLFSQMTNGDYIRAMSDADLSDFLTALMFCCGHDLCGDQCPMFGFCFDFGGSDLLSWLKTKKEAPA